MEYYKLLGVAKNASAMEIKSAYRQMARLYHPDFNPGKNSQTLFVRIKKAFDTLYDPVKRQTYDDSICFARPSPVGEYDQAANENYTYSDEVIFKRKEKPAKAVKSRTIPLLSFTLAGEEYAFNIGDVLSIIGGAKITPLPEANNFIEGLFYARGEELPAVNLAKSFGFSGNDSCEPEAIVLVEIESIKVGLIVGSLPEVIELHEDSIFNLPDILPGEKLLFMKLGRIDERILIILELSQVLPSATIAALKELSRQADYQKD